MENQSRFTLLVVNTLLFGQTISHCMLQQDQFATPAPVPARQEPGELAPLAPQGRTSERPPNKMSISFLVQQDAQAQAATDECIQSADNQTPPTKYRAMARSDQSELPAPVAIQQQEPMTPATAAAVNLLSELIFTQAPVADTSGEPTTPMTPSAALGLVQLPVLLNLRHKIAS